MQLPKLFLTTLTLTATAVLASTPAEDTGCSSACGVDTAQCVNWFNLTDCDNKYKVGQWKVDKCDHTCYSVANGFDSLYLCGDGTYGVSCDVFSDDNCENLLGTTPNAVTAFDHGCSDFIGKSFKCFYQC
jgi:hypothetical protein